MDTIRELERTLEYWAFQNGADLDRYLKKYETDYMAGRRTYRPSMVTALMASHLRNTRQFDENNRDIFLLNPEATRALHTQVLHESQLAEYVERQMRPATSVDKIITRYEEWNRGYTGWRRIHTRGISIPAHTPEAPGSPGCTIMAASTKDYTQCRPSPKLDPYMKYPGEMRVATKELAEFIPISPGRAVDIELWLPTIIKNLAQQTQRRTRAVPGNQGTAEKTIIITRHLKKGKTIFPAQAMHWAQVRGYVERHLEDTKSTRHSEQRQTNRLALTIFNRS